MTMKDGTLSPEELASLSQEVESGSEPQGPSQPSSASQAGFTINTYNPSSFELEALGKFATELVEAIKTGGSTFIQAGTLDVVKERIGAVDPSYFSSKFSGETLVATVHFSGGISGELKMVFTSYLAKVIASIMTGGGVSQSVDSVPLDEASISAISEFLNIVLGGVSARLVPQAGGERIEFSAPQVELLPTALDPSKFPSVYAMVSFKMQIDSVGDDFVVLASADLIKSMVSAFGLSGQVAQQSSPPQFQQMPPQAPPGAPQVPPAYPQQPPYQTPPGYPPAGYPQQPYYPPAPGYPPGAPAMYGNVPSVRPVRFSELMPSSSGVAGQIDFNLLADIPLEVTVELGRTRRLLEEILNWAPGSVIELNKLAGEHVDILVNGKKVAKGEVVVIDENFGVRITDIVPPDEILKKLT